MNITPDLISTFKNVLDVAFGKGFKETKTSGAIKRFLHENNHLDANEKLKSETNEYLAKMYGVMKRNPSIGSHEELEMYLKGE